MSDFARFLHVSNRSSAVPGYSLSPMRENSDIDDDFTLDGKALHRNKKEKDLRKKEDLLALVIMVRVAMRLDDDDDDDDDVVVLVAIVLAPANIIRVCYVLLEK